MSPGIFQCEVEFHKYDGTICRNAFSIGEAGKVLLAFIPGSRVLSHEEIARFQLHLRGYGHLFGTEANLQFRREDVAVSLILRLGEDSIQIIDPQDEEFGGWSGNYKRYS